MTCQECREKWSALLDGEISLIEIKALLGHIQSCQDCCGYCCELTCLNAMVRCSKIPSASKQIWKRVKEKSEFAYVADHSVPEGWVIVRSHLSRLGRM